MTDALQTPEEFPLGRFSGRAAFTERVHGALDWAVRDGWRELIWCDPSFEDWPLNERSVSDALHAWARLGRRFVMVAHSYDTVQRIHPRFVSWRRTWGHLIECHRCSELDASDFPSVWWSTALAMRRLDLARDGGFATVEPARRMQLRELLDEIVRRSSPAFPASTLGL